MAFSSSMIPGRKQLVQRCADPKSNQYERNRARDAYRKQLETFKIYLEADLKRFDRLDSDAKQEIRIKAKRKRETCLQDYRQGLQGLARYAPRRTYKDVFLGDREAAFDVLDPHVLEYELRLQSEIDTLIDNIRLLNLDKSNSATLDWMASLARQKFSYEYEMGDKIDVNALPIFDNDEEHRKRNDQFDDDDCSSVSMMTEPFVYKPFSKRHNLFNTTTDDEGSQTSHTNRRYLYNNRTNQTKSKHNFDDLDEHRSSKNYYEEDDDDDEYKPFTPFNYRPKSRGLDSYYLPSTSSYHSPSFHRITTENYSNSSKWFPSSSSAFNGRFSSNENYYGDDENDNGPMAGIDYEYKPIIPSYCLNGKKHSVRFNYDYEEGEKSTENFPIHSTKDDRVDNQTHRTTPEDDSSITIASNNNNGNDDIS